MKIRFYSTNSKEPEKPTLEGEITVDDNGTATWSADNPMLQQMVTRKLGDHPGPDDYRTLPYHFHGSYFWASLEGAEPIDPRRATNEPA